jgi:hypothetical protein
MPERRFTVLGGQSRLPQAERDAWPATLPWSTVEPWRAQAERNHSLRHSNDITESAAGEWLRGIAEPTR